MVQKSPPRRRMACLKSTSTFSMARSKITSTSPHVPSRNQQESSYGEFKILLDNILCPVLKLPPTFSMTCSKTSLVPYNGLSKTRMIDLHGLKDASTPSDGLFGSLLGAILWSVWRSPRRHLMVCLKVLQGFLWSALERPRHFFNGPFKIYIAPYNGSLQKQYQTPTMACLKTAPQVPMACPKTSSTPLWSD